MKNIIQCNFSAVDMSSVGFYIFQTILSFLLIFGIEPIQGQITNSFIVSLVTICLSYPLFLILALKYKTIIKKLNEKKSNILVLILLLVFIIFVIYFSSAFLFLFRKSVPIFILSIVQIFFFVRNDLIKNKEQQLVKLTLFLFIGILFGWGIFNIIRFAQFFGINFPIGNPVIGIWGLIFYLFNAIWIIDKDNKITNYLYQKRVYLWILAGIMFLFIILMGGNK